MNDCDVLVFVEGSKAVTLTVEVSPAVAPVVSMWTTPLGLAVESVAEVIVTAPTGSESSPPPLVVTGTLSMSARMSETGDELAEDRVAEVEEPRVGIRGEELRGVGEVVGRVDVGLREPGVGQGELAGVGEGELLDQFILERVAGGGQAAGRAGSGGGVGPLAVGHADGAALDDEPRGVGEARGDAEDLAGVVVGVGVEPRADEVLDRRGGGRASGR